MKKIIVFLIIAVFALSVMAACDTGSGDSSSTGAESTASKEPVSEVDDVSVVEESSVETDPYESLKNFNLNEREIKFLVYDDTHDRYQSVEIMSHEDNADVVNDAIIRRNKIVEDLLNCKITEVRVADVLGTARTDILADGQYDILMPYMPEAATLASEGSLINLFEYDDILTLEKTCWDQRANKDLSIDNKLYFTTGDFSLLTFDCTHAIIFNKTVVQQNSAVEDPYQLLRENKWTIDALYRNAKLVTSDTDNVDGMTFTDTWGFFMNTGYATTLFMGSGERLTDKNTEDIPRIACKGEKAVAVAEKIRELYGDAKSTIIIEDYQSTLNGKYSDVYSAATAAVGENRALFRAMAIVDLKELADYEVAYGLLPTPKYTEDQEEYYNIVSAILASSACIHKNVSNIEESCAVLAALAIASTDTVRTAYYDMVLKGRNIADDDGEFALDIMFDNRVYEMATIYSFGDLSSLIMTTAKATSNIYESTLTGMEDAVQIKIDELVDSFQ